MEVQELSTQLRQDGNRISSFRHPVLSNASLVLRLCTRIFQCLARFKHITPGFWKTLSEKCKP
eukprot:8449259-Prorocentrum_lima.AAC.1